MGTHGEKTAEENKAWLARTLKSGQISIAGIFFYRFETVGVKLCFTVTFLDLDSNDCRTHFYLYLVWK